MYFEIYNLTIDCISTTTTEGITHGLNRNINNNILFSNSGTTCNGCFELRRKVANLEQQMMILTSRLDHFSNTI